MPYSEGYRNPYYNNHKKNYNGESSKGNVITVIGMSNILVDPDIGVMTIEDYSSYYNKALVASINDAKSKANIIAKTIGVTINDIPQSIHEQSYDINCNIAKFLNKTSHSIADLSPEGIKISAKVQVIFSY